MEEITDIFLKNGVNLKPIIRRTFQAVIFTIILSSCCDKSSIPELKQALYSSLAKDRNDSALKLARCGDAASGAVPRLIQLMYDSNVGVQSAAAYALRKIDTSEAREALERAEKARSDRRKK